MEDAHRTSHRGSAPGEDDLRSEDAMAEVLDFVEKTGIEFLTNDDEAKALRESQSSNRN